MFASDEIWKRAVGAVALVAWCVISFVSARAKRMTLSVGLFAVAPVALMLSAHFILPRQAFESRFPEAFIRRYAEVIHLEDEVYSTNDLTPAVGWILKRTGIGILEGRGELKYGLNYPDAECRQIRIRGLRRLILLTKS
jgi:4-amino-4-deoxy-L-arabinose transferase